MIGLHQGNGAFVNQAFVGNGFIRSERFDVRPGLIDDKTLIFA